MTGILSHIMEYEPAWLFPVVAFTSVHFFSEPLRWRVYTEEIGTIQFTRLFYIFSVTALISYLFPLKLGIPVRIWLLGRIKEITVAAIVSYMVVDGSIYTLLSALTAIPGVLLLSATLPLLPVLIGAVALAATLYLIGSGHQWVSTHLSPKLQDALASFRRINLRVLLLIGSIILVDIASQLICHLLLLKVVGMDLPWITVVAAAAFAMFVGIASALPLGIGVYDVTMAGLLMGMGARPDQAFSVVLLIRLANLLVCMIVGVPSLWKLGLKYADIQNRVAKVRP